MRFPTPAETHDQSVAGWTRYVLAVTSDLQASHAVDERMTFALAGEDLPEWLVDGIRNELIAVRGQALVERALTRTSG